MTKLIISFGKGGVGKSTISSFVTEILKDMGKSVLCISVDQQHNVSDIIRHYDMKIDYLQATTDVSDWVVFAVKAIGFGGYDDLVPILAGDFISVQSLTSLVWENKNYDYIVCDFPPNCLTLRIITIPSIIETKTFKLLTLKRRIKRMVKGEDPLLDKLELYNEMNKYFVSLLNESMNLVIANADELSFIETLKIVNLLNSLHYGVHRVILNKWVNTVSCSCITCLKFKELQSKWFIEFYKHYAEKLLLVPFSLEKKEICDALKGIIP